MCIKQLNRLLEVFNDDQRDFRGVFPFPLFPDVGRWQNRSLEFVVLTIRSIDGYFASEGFFWDKVFASFNDVKPVLLLKL